VTDQRSPEWYAARLGKVTASRVADVVATVKSGGYGAARANYMAQLIAERLTGDRQPEFVSYAMQNGIDTEAEALSAYEFRTDAEVYAVAFIDHPTIPMSGASPDGLVGDDGLVEIKCPNTSTHIDTLLSGKVPAKYIDQMLWQMACTDRQWCDFASFDPRMPESMRLFVKRVPRDDKRIEYLEKEVGTFLADIEAKVAGLSKLYVRQEAA
jgi:putative phage-type endonuclease